MRGLHIVSLLAREPGLVEQVEHAEHALERGAYLVTHVGQEHALAVVGGFGFVPGHSQLARDGLQFFVLHDLAAQVAHQQRHEQQQHAGLHAGQGNHQATLLAQLGVAFVHKPRGGAVGFAGEFTQRGFDLLDGSDQCLARGARLQKLTGVCKYRVGLEHKSVHQPDGFEVGRRGVEQVVARDVRDHGDAADEHLVALHQMVDIQHGFRLQRHLNRAAQVAEFALELVRLPHDRVDLVDSHVLNQAELFPLDVAQRRQRHQQGSADGGHPMPHPPAVQTGCFGVHCRSSALSCQIERS